MINVNQITSTLAKLPDPALQQYAAMHKNDPYIMALAVAESNRRKEMRGAAQGAQGQMEQPKVADQMIAGMAPAPGPSGDVLPEMSGIGRLPAGNMDFADGGIVAFADRGAVVDEEARNPLAFLNPGDLIDRFGRVLREGIDPRAAEYRRQAALRNLQTPAAETVGKSEFNAAQTALAAQQEQAAAQADAQPAAPKPAADAAAPGAPGLPAGLTGLLTNPAGEFAKMRETMRGAPDPERDRIFRETTALGDEGVYNANRRIKEFDEDIAKRGDVFKDRAERLTKREGELGKQKEENTGLAFLNAGLAIMSTPGGLANAIGKGARVGTEQYAAGLDKLRAAQDRLEDAKDKLDELRINRDDLTRKERRDLTSQRDTAALEARRYMLDAYKTMYGVDEKRAEMMLGKQFDLGLTQLKEAGENARNTSRINAARMSPETNLALMLGEGDTPAARFESGYKKLQELQSDKSGMAAVKLLAEINAKNKAVNDPVITMDDLLGSAREFQASMYPKTGTVDPAKMRGR